MHCIVNSNIVLLYFSLSLSQISEHLLSIYLDDYPETPWEALKFLVRLISSTENTEECNR